MTLPKTVDGACSKCGSYNMILAEDSTHYSNCTFGGGKWTSWPGSDEPSGADNAIRFYCGECGEYHEVPEELP